MLKIIPLAAIALTCACATPSHGSSNETATDAQAMVDGLPNAVSRDGITVGYLDEMTDEQANLVLEEALRSRKALGELVGQMLGDIELRVSNESSVPSASTKGRNNTIYLPVDRVDQLTQDWSYDPFTLVHEMVHLYSAGGRDDRMLAEGIAVYLHTMVGRPTYPDFGEDLHALTLKLQDELGRTIPLTESESYRKAGSSEERRLAYVQEGSFARWFVEQHGLDAFVALMLEKTPYEQEAERWADFEARWREALAASTPEPETEIE